MTVKLSANYINRDAADFALMRLRQGGIAFSVTDIVSLSGRNGESNLNWHSPLIQSNNLMSMSSMGGLPLTSGQEFITAESIVPGHKRGEQLLIKVRTEYLSKAREILTGCGGKDVQIQA